MTFLVSSFLALVLLFFPLSGYTRAQTETPTVTPTTAADSVVNSEKSKLEGKIIEYQRKLEETRKQRNTLANQMEYLDTQAYVTQLRIQETENKIATVEKETVILTNRIDTLDTRLDEQWRLFLATTYETYKQRRATLIDLLLNSRTASDMLNSVKYHSLAQSNRQRLLIQTQETKLNFEEAKQQRERRKIELTELQDVLDTQKASLDQQQTAKKILITATQNRENEYQSIISEAQRQLSAFKSFFASTGTYTISANALGTGEGGWYYSQRDERWAGMRMGDSGESVLDVGCFISSLSMVLKSYGQDINPTFFASNSKYFYGGSSSGCFPTSYATAYACVPNTFNGSWPGGLRYREISSGEIDGYLERGIPVITSVRNQGHYVVLKKKVDGEYIMNDPIYGPDLKLSEYYTMSGRYAVFEQ